MPALSDPARAFWRRLTAFRRTAFDGARLVAAETQARLAAARLDGTDAAPSHAEWIRRRRSPEPVEPVDFPAVVLELQARGLVVLQWAERPGVDMRRCCPKCAGVLRWLVVRGGVEAPWCSSCGALDFWLVLELDPGRPIGYGCPGGGALW